MTPFRPGAELDVVAAAVACRGYDRVVVDLVTADGHTGTVAFTDHGDPIAFSWTVHELQRWCDAGVPLVYICAADGSVALLPARIRVPDTPPAG